jgi:hypothetical protein
LEQYSRFDVRTLAVRGEQLHLGWGRWSDAAGNETAHLYVHEVDERGRIEYEGRFDEDDFEGAYRELERRYYAGEGAACAEAGMAIADYEIAKNRGDLDTLFGELSTPDLRIKSRSRSVFVDRSAAEYRASVEELIGLVGSAREWLAAVRWVSPRWFVAHLDREAVGREGEQYEWTRLIVGEVRDGRLASVCDFDVEDEEQAFAYAEERIRAAASRLPVTNRASEVAFRIVGALQARDIDGVVAPYSDQVVYDDRGDSVVTRSRAMPRCEPPLSASWSSTAPSRIARWPFAVSACSSPRPVGPTTPGTRPTIYMCSSSATTDGSPMRAASTRTTSRVLTASSKAATTPARARHTPNRAA